MMVLFFLMMVLYVCICACSMLRDLAQAILLGGTEILIYPIGVQQARITEGILNATSNSSIHGR